MDQKKMNEKKNGARDDSGWNKKKKEWLYDFITMGKICQMSYHKLWPEPGVLSRMNDMVWEAMSFSFFSISFTFRMRIKEWGGDGDGRFGHFVAFLLLHVCVTIVSTP